MKHRKPSKSNPDDLETRPGVAAVNRAFTMLEVFTKEHPAFTLAQLAQRTGLYKSTLLRLSESLEHFGYLQRSQMGVFTLGPAPMRLATLYQSSLHPAEIVMPVLRELVAQTSESAAFYVRAGNQRLCAYRAPSSRAVSDNIRQGELLALECGAGGHILLAFSGKDGQRYTDIRQQLYSVTRGERDHETAAVACPVFGPGQALEGALSLSGPIQRFTDPIIKSMRGVLLEAAKRLTTALGGDTEPYDLSARQKMRYRSPIQPF